MSEADLMQKLSSIIDDLTDDEFKRFKWHLKLEKVDDIEPIKNNQLAKAEQMETVELICQKYQSRAPVVMNNVLVKLNRNDLVTKLSKNLGLAGASPAATPCAQNQEPGADKKLKAIRVNFIEKMSLPLLTKLQNVLLDQEVIADYENDAFNDIKSSSTRATSVIDVVIKKGPQASSILIDTLCKEDKYMAKNLQLM